MHRLLLLVLALIVLGIEILMGSRAFFPELFENRSSGVEDILADKENILKQLSPEDLAYVSKNPVVTVGVDPNFYPLEMFDERGRYTGLGGDYIKILSKMTGLTFKPIALDDWATTEGEANRGMIDMFMVAAKTGRRSEFMLFTAPFISMPGIIMTRRGSGLDNINVKDLAGKKVAVVDGYSWHDFLKEFHPEITAVPSRNTLEALQKVADGEVDAILDYEFNLLEKIQLGGVMQMQKAGTVDSSYGHAVAVAKNKPELYDAVSFAMDKITPREKELLAQKWLAMDKPAGQERQLQWIFFFVTQAVLLLLAVFSIYDNKVKKEVGRRLRQLAQNCQPEARSFL